MTARRTTGPGNETTTVTRPEGTRSEIATTAGEIAAAVTAAVVVAAGAKNALATETERGTEIETETAADRDLAHGVAPGAEAEVCFYFPHLILLTHHL